MGCCGDNVVKQCTVTGADPGIIPEEISDVLSNSIARIEYELNENNYMSTGFFIKFTIKQKLYHFFLTCEHSIKKEILQNEREIFLYFGKIKNEKVLKIKLDKNQRFIQTNETLDVSIIQILPQDNISEDKFLLPDFNYLNGNINYINKQIYIGSYPDVIEHKKEKHFSSGVIRSIAKNKINFFHSADTREGSSGSPIINSDKKVVGIHDGEYNGINYGTFIGSIINELNNEGNNENIIDDEPFENNNKVTNDNEKNNDINKNDKKNNENEQPKENNQNNTFDQNSYVNNLINTSPILSLDQQSAQNFGNILGNPNYLNYVKNYYSNPAVREMLNNDQNFKYVKT